MAIFAKIAYLVIPDYELRHQGLAKLIPCLTYQQLLASGHHISVEDFLRSGDFANSFVLQFPRAVAVTIIRPELIVVALRGTRPLYLSDWAIDATVSRTYVRVGDQRIRLHTGFFRTTLDFVEALSSEIKQRITPHHVPIYITGHSLGGALAALTHGLANINFHGAFNYGFDIFYKLGVHSSYTYGMPRYGNKAAVQVLDGPDHIINQNDLVPNVPPKLLGFSDPRKEHVLIKGNLLLNHPRSSSWFGRVHLARGLRHHFIERYIRNLRV